MTEFSNDEIYLELRRMHRRMMAILLQVACLFLAAGLALLNPSLAPLLIIAALEVVVLGLAWLYANRNDGLVRRFVEWWRTDSGVEWDRDLEEEVEA